MTRTDWVCPMHPEIVRDAPGARPICGMALEPRTVAAADEAALAELPDIYFGDPLTFTGRADDEDAELDKKVKVVKAAIQTMLDQGLRERKHVFW